MTLFQIKCFLFQTFHQLTLFQIKCFLFQTFHQLTLFQIKCFLFQTFHQITVTINLLPLLWFAKWFSWKHKTLNLTKRRINFQTFRNQFSGKRSLDRISVDQNCVLSLDRNCGNQLIEFHLIESVDRKFK
jgi:hypothetical protein